MKKLNRSLANTPICLTTKSSWNDMKSRDKKKVWIELYKFQERFCVYCESEAYQGGTGHLEHFFDKATHIHLALSWDNLFGCCESRGHCGHYKDQNLPGGRQRQYNTNLLLKPDVDDPEYYLQFTPSGSISTKSGLNVCELSRAKETIIALYLNAPSLNIAREDQIKLFEARLLSLESLSVDDLDLDLYISEFTSLKEDANNAPHRTAIKQVLFSEV